ncbi:MAG: hypothetical protein ACTSRI_06835 [Promethearchaeota archaeon]
MDYKDFHDGLLSLCLVIFTFSLTFMVGSISLKPLIGLEQDELILIIILCFTNFLFCAYYLLETLRLKKIFKLEDKHAFKFGKRLGIVSACYIPHFILIISLFFRNLHDLEILMVILIFFMEGLLLGLVFKEVYDLVFLEESERKIELELNRKRYIWRES